MLVSGGTERWQADAPLPEVALLAARPWAQAESLGRQRYEDAIEAATADDLRSHPAVLLHYARLCEPGMRLGPRRRALERLEEILAEGGRGQEELRLELWAEQALDEAREAHLDRAEELARRVLDAEPGPERGPRRPGRGDRALAAARASDALGRTLAWRGDRPSVSEGQRRLYAAAGAYHQMGAVEWQANAIFWSAKAVRYQAGDLVGAGEQMCQALGLLGPDSPRRAAILDFYADVLITLGRWAEAEDLLDEALGLAIEQQDEMGCAYVAWSRAIISSVHGDGPSTVRNILEAERHKGDWYEGNTGPTFLADCAELLDRVGEADLADRYLAQAQQRAPDDEFVAQAAAALAARRGDPEEALRRLRRLAQAPWLEKRMVWRHTLFAAYASLRARRAADAGLLAARAIDQAAAMGGAEVAVAGEPDMVATLAPLAAAAGSVPAAALLAPGDGIIVRLLGQARVWRGAVEVSLPIGPSGALVRLLALHPAGLEIDEVIEALWPEADAVLGGRRLRDARSRLTARCGELVLREGSRLLLTSGWVDVTAFRRAADRALRAAPGEATALVAAGLALWGGDPLLSDPYADWAEGPRAQLRRRHVQLLDLAVEDAVQRGSLDEACTVLEEGIEADMYEEHRYLSLSELHARLGHGLAARRALERARDALARLELEPSSELKARLATLQRT